jgi:hypothetical protein
VSHHVRNADFSRWVDGVLRDHILASRFRRIERAHPDQADAEAARTQLLTALEQRYLG